MPNELLTDEQYETLKDLYSILKELHPEKDWELETLSKDIAESLIEEVFDELDRRGNKNE